MRQTKEDMIEVLRISISRDWWQSLLIMAAMIAILFPLALVLDLRQTYITKDWLEIILFLHGSVMFGVCGFCLGRTMAGSVASTTVFTLYGTLAMMIAILDMVVAVGIKLSFLPWSY